MPFTLRVHFLGLCHFVENRDKKAPVKMCVVLPEAADHDGVVRLGKGALTDTNGQEIPSVDLRRKRMTFRFDGDEGAKSFNFGPDAHRGVVAMKDIASIFADENPSIVRANPPSDVRAQVLLDRGEFKIDPNAIMTKWRIPASVRSDGYKDVEVADKLFVDIDVPGEFVEITFRTLGSRAGVETYTLKPQDGIAEITVSNECPPPPDGTQQVIDKDFVFHYNLLSPEALSALKRRVGRGGLPLPEKPDANPTPQDRNLDAASLERGEKGKSKSTIGESSPTLGCNCVPSFGNERFIGLNTFIPKPEATSRRSRSSVKH